MMNLSSSWTEARKADMKVGCCGSQVMVVYSQTNTVVFETRGSSEEVAARKA